MAAIAFPLQAARFGDFDCEVRGEVTITGYIGPGGDVVIPEIIGGKPVTSIGSQAFSGCTSLAGITIPNSVTSIGFGAFALCTSLTSISIPEGVTSIEKFAFDRCTELANITIPEGVIRIGYEAFVDCSNLKEVIIPNSVTTIQRHAFVGCRSLCRITIPDGVTLIEPGAFVDCSSLTDITVSPLNPAYCSLDGLLLDKKRTSLIACISKEPRLTVPEGIMTIGAEAFRGCGNLTDIEIPDSVRSIGYLSLLGCAARVYFEGDEPDYSSFFLKKPLDLRLPGTKSPFTGVLYYRPGSANWDSARCSPGHCVRFHLALWIPLSLGESDPALFAPLRLLSTVPASATLRVQRSTNLRDWEDWMTVSRDDGPGELHDAEAGSVPRMFYRMVDE